MNKLVEHRGPDDSGIFIDQENNIGLGHQRLSILDLSADGHQPMQVDDGAYTIVFNGEIYNYLELKDELLAKGYCFRTKTDTEVIIKAYQEWNTDCVRYFNGMWAFALYDKINSLLFCSRDRFGIKPFYYTETGGKFIFGSEIKQLLPFHTKNTANISTLMNYLISGFENYSNETFFDGVFQLGQSSNLIFCLQNRNFHIEKYYDLKHSPDNTQLLNDAVKNYKNALFESIKLRLRSDVKVGTCLSGGLDSSSIAAVAAEYQRKEKNQDLTAIHAKSSMKASDESRFAIRVSEHCRLNMKLIEPDSIEFKNMIDEVVYTQEEPFVGVSVFMQYFVMQKAKALNCTVMLDGQGGDETLLGYERYYPAYLFNLGFIGFVKALLESSGNSKLSLLKILMYFFYFTNANLRIKRYKKNSRFLKPEYLEVFDQALIRESAYAYKNIFNLQNIEIFTLQMPRLLRYEDKNSMRHSIEARLPFLDFNLLETAVNTNNRYKIKNGWTKLLLRKTVENLLPADIVWRKNKFGFEAPTNSWLKSIEPDMKLAIDNSTIIGEISCGIKFEKLNQHQRWRLFNIAKWEELYDVKLY